MRLGERLFHVLKKRHLLDADEGERRAGLIATRRAANTVHVRIHARWEVKVHHIGNVLKVDASGHTRLFVFSPPIEIKRLDYDCKFYFDPSTVNMYVDFVKCCEENAKSAEKDRFSKWPLKQVRRYSLRTCSKMIFSYTKLFFFPIINKIFLFPDTHLKEKLTLLNLGCQGLTNYDRKTCSSPLI